MIAAPPARKFATIWRVTSEGYGADAFFDDAVIGAENQHRFAADLRRIGTLDQAELQHQIFQPAEAARGFGQRIETGADAGFERWVGDGSNSKFINLRAGEEDQDENFEQLLGCAQAIAVDAADAFVEIRSRDADDEVGAEQDHQAGAPAAAAARRSRPARSRSRDRWWSASKRTLAEAVARGSRDPRQRDHRRSRHGLRERCRLQEFASAENAPMPAIAR